MRAVDLPGIGRGGVLPPPKLIPLDAGKWGRTVAKQPVYMIGDTVDIEEECPTCEGDRAVLCTNPACACLRCVPCPDCSTGTVSVPHVVTEVLPIVANEDMPNPDVTHLEIVGQGGNLDPACALWTFKFDDYTFQDIYYIPDAEPGGVVLVVERKP